MDGEHLTYNPSSPAFDYLPLRRVKPLPKRKRSSPEPARSPSLLNPTLAPTILPPPPGPGATAEELIAHAEVLSAQITFQSYFLPAPDFASTTTTTTGGGGGGGGSVETPPPSVDVLEGAATPADRESSREGGDHADQMQQQGNAKKRKVPAHLSGSQMGPDSADVHSAGEEELSGAERGPLLNDGSGGGFAAGAAPEQEDGPSASGADVDGRRRRGKVLPATMVGLRQKEMLKHRRRQLGMPALGDSLALDQALLAKYALPKENRSSGVSRSARLKSRWVRRRASRVVVRRHRTLAPPSEPTRRIFPDGEFTFTSLSAASERLIATRAEYTVLYDRVEYELARQVDKAAESAKEQAAVGAGKRGERAVRKARAITQSAQDTTDTPAVSKTPSSTKTSGKKKKKRSALANASNPHHLRNYVPSRVPNQGHLSAAQLGANTQNLLSPLPLLFLSAQIPPRRGNNAQSWTAGAPQLGNPGEEWICPTCEYRLFYGDEQGYRIGVRNRKKILKRRRRARERAAAAANGSGTGAGVDVKGSGFDDEEDLDIETTGSGLALSPTRLAKVERDKGGDAG